MNRYVVRSLQNIFQQRAKLKMQHIKTGLIILMVFFTSQVTSAEEKFLSDFHGESRSIEEFTGNGKWLVLMIWAHDCHVCNQEAENYVHFHDEHKNRDAQVLGLSLDGVGNKAKAEEFINNHDLSFPSLIGEPENIMLYYQIQTGSSFVGTPTFMIFNPQGKLLAAQAGAVPPELIEKFIAGKNQ